MVLYVHSFPQCLARRHAPAHLLRRRGSVQRLVSDRFPVRVQGTGAALAANRGTATDRRDGAAGPPRDGAGRVPGRLFQELSPARVLHVVHAAALRQAHQD